MGKRIFSQTIVGYNMKKEFAYLIWILIIVSCNNRHANDIGLKEIKRITSPDKLVDAVLIETNGGATVALGNKVILVSKGKKIFEDELR